MSTITQQGVQLGATKDAIGDSSQTISCTGTSESTHCHFDAFMAANDLQDILSRFDELRIHCGVKEGDAYATIKDKVSCGVTTSAPLWKLLDTRRDMPDYSSTGTDSAHAVVIGAGIAGIRTAIEFALLKVGSVTVVEKRDTYSRNNALHIWPATIEDFRAIGVKFFYPKLCVGQINHVSIRQLQCALTKVALLLGVKFLVKREFLNLVPSSESGLWEVEVGQPPSPAALPKTIATAENVELVTEQTEGTESPTKSEQLLCNILIGADGEKSHVCEQLQFERKVFQGGRAIGITANFENTGAPDESNLDEFGLLSIYNQDFFAGLKEKDIDLENLVFYRDETHYFVMTAKKPSLLKTGVLKADCEKNAELLHPDNVDVTKLKQFIRDVATYCKVPEHCTFVKNQTGLEDIGIFDFSRKLACTKPAKFIDHPSSSGKPCLAAVVGDALVEPFWPLGTGANRAVLGAMDVAWLAKGFCEGKDHDILLKDAQQVYDVLQVSSPEDLKHTFRQYTIDPQTRYKFALTGMGH